MSSNNSEPKKKISSAKKAYITSDGRYIEEPAESEEVEELKKPRQMAKPQDSIISKAVKSNPESSANQKSDFQQKRKREFKKLDSELEHENDIFDEDGNIIEEESEIKQKLKDLEQKIEQSLNRILDIIKKPFLVVKNKFLLITAKFLAPLIKVLGFFEKFLSRFKKEEPVKEEVEQIQPQKKMTHGSFEDMISLNVTLTDNYDAPLYKKRSIALAKSEESLILLEAKDAIKQCAEFTKSMPPVQSGLYEGREISEIMENVSEEDITLFLGYIKARPQRYVSKSWKISETFATWLVNNAPVAEED